MMQKGFTLVEVLVAVVLVLICGGIVAQLFIGHNRLYRVETAELNITNDARVALDDIDNYVLQANRVLASYSTFTSDAQTLILQIQSVNAANALIAGYDNVVFYLDNGSLYREVFPNGLSARPAGIKKLASNVNDLEFTYNNASFPLVTSVATDISLQEDAGVQTRAITVSSQALLRNY